jgi:hypothetical protein
MSVFEAIKTFDAAKVKTELMKENAVFVREPETGFTPLMRVALHKRDPKMHPNEYEIACDAIVSELVARGGDKLVNDTDWVAGRTALHWACAEDNLTFYNALYKHTKEKTWWYYRDFAEKTPVAIARENQFTDLMEAMERGRKERAGSGPNHVAIIGVGPAGLALFIRLVKRLQMTGRRYGDKFLKNHVFHLIDKQQSLAVGTPYSEDLNSPLFLLNVQAQGMSIDHDQPLDFVLWLKELELKGELSEKIGVAADLKICPASARADGYYPRVLYGKYLVERLNHWTNVAKDQLGIEVHAVTSSEVVSTHETKEGYEVTVQGADGKTSTIDATYLYYTTGHFPPPEKFTGEDAWLNEKKAVVPPMAPKEIEAKGIHQHPANIGVLGAALSGVDAIFAILLNPAAGTLVWHGNEPSYLPVKEGGNIKFKVTCYSRKGLFSKVRPESNKDLDLTYLNASTVAKLLHMGGGKISLPLVIEALNEEFRTRLGKEGANIDVTKLADPFAGRGGDPFEYLKGDIDWAAGGDGRTKGQEYVLWYQIMHSLLPVIKKIFRNFSPGDRAEFQAKYDSNFLWAFAPMPLRSAKILYAMHKAGVLELHRSTNKPTWKDGRFEINYLDYENKDQTGKHDFFWNAAGLGTDLTADPRKLSKNSLEDGSFILDDPYMEGAVDEKSGWITDDGTFEIVEKDQKRSALVHSVHRRGVGYFLRPQLFDSQAVPSVVKYSSQAAEIYYDEFVFRSGKSVVTGADLKSSK